MANGEAHQARNVADLQLHHDAAAIRVNAGRLDAHDGGDFFARPAFGHELQNLAFARTQHAQRSRLRILLHRGLMNRHAVLAAKIAGIATGVCRETCTAVRAVTRWII